MGRHTTTPAEAVAAARIGTTAGTADPDVCAPGAVQARSAARSRHQRVGPAPVTADAGRREPA